MNGSRAVVSELLSKVREGTADLERAQVAVCLPFPYLTMAGKILNRSPIQLGAQDVSDEESGAFTGEVSAAMLSESGCQLVIVGHSERRVRQHETDDQVAAKAFRAINHGLTAVVCVGEKLDQHDQGRTEEVVTRQMGAVLATLDERALEKLVIAYEPVWAIGTGRSAKPEHAQAVHAHLRGLVAARLARGAESVRIIYGGSVRADNAQDLFEMTDVDGALVGGASLSAPEFLSIVTTASDTLREYG